jgi:hypothetical protein
MGIRLRYAVACILFAGVAHAETPEEAADRLFKEAEVLASAGRYAEACPKLEESQRLDSGIGTEFNLADCYEQTGRVAHAYRLFEEVAKIARASGKVERANASTARAAALEPRLSRVRLVVDNPPSGLAVSVDGDAATVGAAQPVEAGDHTLEASAPGRVTWRKTVNVSLGTKVDVQVPPLDALPTQRAPSSGLPAQRIVAIGFGAAGVAAAITGGVAGALALAWHNEADSACPGAKCPSNSPGFNTWHQAVIVGDVSTVAFVAAGGLLATAAVLWFTAPKSKTVTAGLVVRPTEVGLEGRF